MRPEAILLPTCVLALWTFVVLHLSGYKRVGAVRARRVSREAFRMGESAEVPPDVSVVNRHFMNLLEVPVLFYAACVALYATHLVVPGMIWLAWSFVALRLVHSVIHLGGNRIVPRLLAFELSNLPLMALWLWFTARLC